MVQLCLQGRFTLLSDLVILLSEKECLFFSRSEGLNVKDHPCDRAYANIKLDKYKLNTRSPRKVRSWKQINQVHSVA